MTDSREGQLFTGTPTEYAEPGSGVTFASLAAAVEELSSRVIDIGNPVYGLPTFPAPADTALAAAYAATPVGGTLDLGDRDIQVVNQLTIAKKITIRRGRIFNALKRIFLVTAAGVRMVDVTLNRTATDGTSGSAVTWNAIDGRVDNLTSSSVVGAAFEGNSGSCNGLRINGGYFTTAHTGGANAIIVESGAQNDNIRVNGATIRHTGYGTGITLYSSSNSVIENCDVRGIRASPWFDIGAAWTLFSGSVWRTPERTDGVQSNAVWVGTDSGTWLTTKVEYLEGSSTTLSAGYYFANSDGYIYIRLTDSSDPNSKFTRTRRTNGYGILLYNTGSATTGIRNNRVAHNYVSDTDGFGIYFQCGLGTSYTALAESNRTEFNLCEDVCKLGVAVSVLPFSGIGFLAPESLTMVGDIVRRAGTVDFPCPGVKINHSTATATYPKAKLLGVRSEDSGGSGFLCGLGSYRFTSCVALRNGGNGFTNGSQVAGSMTVELIGCTADQNGQASAASGMNFSGTTTVMRVSVIGGQYTNNTLRGIIFTTCVDSKIIGTYLTGNTQQGINVATCSRLYIAGNMSGGDDDIIVDSATTGLVYIPGGEDTGTTVTLSPALYRTGHQQYQGTGTPESVVTAPVGATFRRTDGGGGTVLYVKEIGTGNTGWVAKGSVGSQFNYLSTLGTDPFVSTAVSTAQTVGTANLGFAILVKPLTDITVNFMDWVTGSVSAGNYDIGIYSADGATKLWSKGSTAWPTASSRIIETVSAVSLLAGVFYRVILSGSDATANFRGHTFVAGMGALIDGTFVGVSVSSAVPLGTTINVSGSSATKIPLITLRNA